MEVYDIMSSWNIHEYKGKNTSRLVEEIKINNLPCLDFFTILKNFILFFVDAVSLLYLLRICNHVTVHMMINYVHSLFIVFQKFI